ncbi:MAG: NAD-dependent epimerase/dehydratase family protein [Pseudomonadota bacterium]
MRPLVIGITGATGFVGRRFLHMAAERGHVVRCLVRPGSVGKLDPEMGTQNMGAHIVQGELDSPDDLQRFVQGLDVVVHLAAHVAHGTQEQYRRVNVEGSANLCEAILAVNPDCLLVHCSSVAVLRRYRALPFFNTLYTASKAQAERAVRRYAAERALRACYCYPGLVYGPRDDKFVPTLLKYIQRGALFKVSGGEQWAPLVYVDDLCRLLLHIVSAPAPLGRSYIGVGAQEVGMHEFFRMLARRVLAKEAMRLTLPKHVLMPLALAVEGAYRLLGLQKMPLLSRRAVDVLSINLDPAIVRRANRGDWNARTSLSAGLERTFDWLKRENRL